MHSSGPFVFVHGLLQMLGDLGAAEFLAPRLAIIPDLPGYAGNRSIDRGSVSIERAADYLHEQDDAGRAGWFFEDCERVDLRLSRFPRQKADSSLRSE